jgi:hypothetical protein
MYCPRPIVKGDLGLSSPIELNKRKSQRSVYNEYWRGAYHPLVHNSVHHIPNGLVAMISACHVIPITTSRGRPGFDSLLRSISEMAVLQVQSLPVLANQHRQISFSSSFCHVLRPVRHRKSFSFGSVSDWSLTRGHSRDPRRSSF